MAVTTGALVQDALNIATAIQKPTPSAIDIYTQVADLSVAVICLADALYAVMNAAATPALTTSVATTPVIGAQYSATATWPVTPVTGIR